MWQWRTRRRNWKWTCTSHSVLLVTGITYRLAYNYTKNEKVTWLYDGNKCLHYMGGDGCSNFNMSSKKCDNQNCISVMTRSHQSWHCRQSFSYHIFLYISLWYLVHVNTVKSQNIGDVFLLKIVRWKVVMKLFFLLYASPLFTVRLIPFSFWTLRK